MNKNTSSGIGFGGLLTIVFITLKLCHVIDWSWWWVTCPIWGVFAFALAVFLVCLVLAAFGYLVACFFDR